eukprot:3430207-Amphidinium_carterae.1
MLMRGSRRSRTFLHPNQPSKPWHAGAQGFVAELWRRARPSCSNRVTLLWRATELRQSGCNEAASDARMHFGLNELQGNCSIKFGYIKSMLLHALPRTSKA